MNIDKAYENLQKAIKRFSEHCVDEFLKHEERMSTKENEMNKCEWKENDLSCCTEMKKIYGGKLNTDKPKFIMLTPYGKIDFCPFCGADIRKPEPTQPIIKKSGGTLIGYENGIDYLLVDVNDHILDMYAKKDYKILSILTVRNDEHFGIWKPISEIEITDEIAKLRPMLITEGILQTLYGVVDSDHYIVLDKESLAMSVETKTYCLATVADLEDS